MISELTNQLKADEGVRRCVYEDHLGWKTIGVGRLVDDRKPGSGLRDDEINYLLRNDIEDRINALGRALPWFHALDDARKGVLLNMAFQMGTAGLLAFTSTLEAVRLGEYDRASLLMLKSKWATQTPERAKRLSKQMQSGEWQ